MHIMVISDSAFQPSLFKKKNTFWAKSKKTSKWNYLAMLWLRRSNDRVIQNQSHRSEVNRVSWRRFASRVIHAFLWLFDSISVIFIRFVSIERFFSMCAKQFWQPTHSLRCKQWNPLSSDHVPRDWRLLLFNTVNKAALWYYKHKRNTKVPRGLRLYQRFSPEWKRHWFYHNIK